MPEWMRTTLFSNYVGSVLHICETCRHKRYRHRNSKLLVSSNSPTLYKNNSIVQENDLLPFNKLSRAQKHRRKSLFMSVIDILGLSESEALSILIKQASSILSQKKDLSRKARDSLIRFSISLSITPTVNLPGRDAAALLMYKKYTERGIQFIRTISTTIPPVKNIRKARWSLLENMPRILILRNQSSRWECLPKGRNVFRSALTRDIVCVRLSLASACHNYLNESLSTDTWPTPPPLRTITTADISKTLVLLASIDAGTGTTKFMVKFLRNSADQSTENVLLISEYTATSESFESLNRFFSPIARELEAMENDGIAINGIHFKLQVYFVCDFKLYYSATGNFGPVSRYSCFYCGITKDFLDNSVGELRREFSIESMDNLPERPAILDLRGKSDNGRWQRKDTYNIFRLRSTNYWNTVPPPLHIRLGLINKLLEVFDNTSFFLDRSIHWIPTRKSKNTGPWARHLALCLASIGARRECYYSGKMSGVPCSRFMKKMDVLCELFFKEDIYSCGNSFQLHPFLINTCSALKVLGKLYTGKDKDDKTGLAYFFSSQSIWSVDDLDLFNIAVHRFIRKFKEFLVRDAGPRSLLSSDDEYDVRVPAKMPKLHTLVTHAAQFAENVGYWGLFSEECFEHFQQISLAIRNRHCQNRCLGGQIVDDITYSWILCSPEAKAARKRAQRIISQTKNKARMIRQFNK